MPNPAANLTTPAQRQSVESICDLDAGRLYAMEYTADYRLDDLLTAGVKDVPALTRYVRETLLLGGMPPDGEPDAGGSAFFARQTGGGCLCGRDLACRTDMAAVLLRTQPEGAYASLSLVNAGWAGYGHGSLSDGVTDLSMTMAFPYLILDGMNEKGLFVSASGLSGRPVRQNTGKPAAMTTVLLRLALDRAASAGEAAALFAAYDMQGAADGSDFQFLLADASGRAVVVEYADNSMHILDADSVSGFYLHPAAADTGADRRAHTLARAALDCRGNTLTRRDAMALLRLLRRDGKGGDQRDTRWSAVYDLTDRALDVAVCRDYTRVYHFSLYGELAGMWT